MKNQIWAVCTYTILSILCVVAKHSTAEEPTGLIDAQSAFEKLKGVVGEWKGTVQDKSGGPAVEVRYKLTAHQTAVVETLFPDTDHEMMTIYYMDGDWLMATHYCAMGNQPRFRLATNSKPNELIFEFAGGGQSLNPEEDIHMHGGRITFIKENQIESEWDVFSGGKKEGSNRFFISQIR
jgi:hypothetical protein